MVMLTRTVLTILAAAASLVAQGDGLQREGKPEQRVAKDALEGKAPPALAVGEWLNTSGPVSWASLRGKVVLIDFWGVW